MTRDLEAPTYRQADVLKLIPGLKMKALQNWLDRRLIVVSQDVPGKAGTRLYRPADVILLDFMAEAVRYKIPPTPALDLAIQLADAALDFLESGPETLDPGPSGYPWIVVDERTIEGMRRGFIHHMRDDDSYLLALDGQYSETLINPADRWALRTGRDFCIVVEVDYRAAMLVNRMAQLDAGRL